MHDTVVVSSDALLEEFLILWSFVDHLGHVNDATRDRDLIEVVKFWLVYRAIRIKLRVNTKLAVNAVQRVNLWDSILPRAMLTVHLDEILRAGFLRCEQVALLLLKDLVLRNLAFVIGVVKGGAALFVDHIDRFWLVHKHEVHLLLRVLALG